MLLVWAGSAVASRAVTVLDLRWRSRVSARCGVRTAGSRVEDMTGRAGEIGVSLVSPMIASARSVAKCVDKAAQKMS